MELEIAKFSHGKHAEHENTIHYYIKAFMTIHVGCCVTAWTNKDIQKTQCIDVALVSQNYCFFLIIQSIAVLSTVKYRYIGNIKYLKDTCKCQFSKITKTNTKN